MGMVLEPGGVSNQLVTATATGELKFIDFRMHDALGGRLGVYKTLDAHSKGSLSAVVGHPHAPLIATGTTTQVTKDHPLHHPNLDMLPTKMCQDQALLSPALSSA